MKRCDVLDRLTDYTGLPAVDLLERALKLYAAVTIGVDQNEESVFYTNQHGRPILLILPAGHRRLLAENARTAVYALALGLVALAIAAVITYAAAAR